MLAMLSSGRIWLALFFGLLLAGCDDPAERALRHHDRGLSLIESDSPEKAALEFRNALRLDESFVAARFELAKLLELSGDLNGALANLRAVIERDPAHAPARIRLANAMLMANEPERAMEHAEIAVRAAPQLPGALIARSMAAYRLGDKTFALQDAKQALLLEPGSAEAGLVLAIERYDSGARTDAHALLDQFIARNPQAFTLHLTKLRYLDGEADATATGKQLSRMVELFPDNTELRRSMIDWHLQAGDLSTAELELRELQRLLPEDPAPIRARVSLIARSDGNQAARAVLVDEIAEASNPDPLRLQLAQFDHEVGERDLAVTQLRQLIGDTNDPEVASQARLSLARIQGAELDFEAVDATASEILDNDPGNAEALALRSAARLSRGSLEEALFDIRGALTEQPGNVGFLTLAAQIYQRNGSPVLSGESLASAVRESGHEWEVVQTYATHLQRVGDQRGIQTLLSDTHRKHPENPEVIKALAQLQIVKQDWHEAERFARALRQFEPDAALRIFAEISMGRQRYDEALAMLDQLSLGAVDSAVPAAKVRAHLRAGDKSAARAVIDESLAASPKDETLLHLNAAWYELERQPDLAEEGYRKIVSTFPGLPSGYVSLASYLERSGRSPEARTVLNDGLGRDPANPLLRLQLATLAMRDGDHTAAIQQFERIYADQPASLLAANNLASALADYASDDPVQVERAEKIARPLAGASNPAFKDTYGWTRVLADDAKGGLAHLEAAAKALPGNPWVQYHTGMAHLAVGNPAESRRYLQSALELSDDAPFPPRTRIRQVLEEIAG